MKRRFCFLLFPVLILILLVPARAASLPFSDVPAGVWYYSDVENAWRLGLVNGKAPTLYQPDDEMTCAEAVKLAACMHQTYTRGSVDLTNGADWWCQPYVDYAWDNGIIETNYDWDRTVSRAVYLDIFSRALPEAALPAINVVADGAVPDVSMTHPQAEGIYKMYRAGIVQGVDSSFSCAPDTGIKRSEVAAVVSRMMDSGVRKHFRPPAPMTAEVLAAAKRIVTGYQNAAIPENRKVNVVVIQMEAYGDISKFGISGLSSEVFRPFHELAAKSYTGTLITDIFGGSTTETEWAVLTGGNKHDDFAGKTNSVAWYMKTQGYTVNGSHPCRDWFYDRKHVNPNLGLENYLFTDNYFYKFIEPGADVAYDAVYFPDLTSRLRSYFSKDQAPLFSFNVTYQGHGPYETDKNRWNVRYFTGPYTKACLNAVNNYCWIVHDTGVRLNSFVDMLARVNKPVVLLLYADHMPWLGYAQSFYREMGINLDLNTEQGFRNYYSTWYLFWANDAAKAALGWNFTGTGPDLSPCFLMDHFFQKLGWTGSDYMQAQRQIAAAHPVLHTTGWITENGRLVKTPSEEKTYQDIDLFQQLSYFDRHRFDGK